MKKIKIFVGASSEAKEITQLVRSDLEKLGADVLVWERIFKPGMYFLESLLSVEFYADAAILIANPDDKTNYRGNPRWSPRDNVLLELGLCLSTFGKERTGIVHVKGDKIKASLPTDLAGIQTIEFNQVEKTLNQEHLSEWYKGILEQVNREYPQLALFISYIRQKLKNVPVPWRADLDEYILNAYRERLDLVSEGQIVLTPGQYYHAIHEEIDKAKPPVEIYAVAALSSKIWNDDEEQQEYLENNINASKDGVKIRRLYMVPDKDWEEHLPIVKAQIKGGIKIKRVKDDMLSDAASLEDMVLFYDPNSETARAFIADHDIGSHRRIRRGRLILNPEIHLRNFKFIWKRSKSIHLKELKKGISKKIKTVAPGPKLEEHELKQPVVSCEEASKAKGIPLGNELKTLILDTQIGNVALHIPGDENASLRKVKDTLEVKNASLASLLYLKELGLSPGTVSAVNEPVWSMPHLVDKSVLTKKYVSTNNGTLRKYYKFDPKILLEANSVIRGDFLKKNLSKN